MDLVKRELEIELFEIYQDLLTKKQQEYFIAYYYDDLSLAEIAENNDVSRNAVFDQIKKVVAILEDYEEKLQIKAKKEKLEAFSKKLPEELKKELEEII